jgi:hypothetical protein
LDIIKILQGGRKPFYCFIGLYMELTTNPYAYVDRSAKLENGEEI